jgi:hypothetical protein
MSAALRLEETARPHTAYEMGFLLRYFSYRALREPRGYSPVADFARSLQSGRFRPARAGARKCQNADEVLLHQSYCTL